jgi:hypothetical protein
MPDTTTVILSGTRGIDFAGSGGPFEEFDGIVTVPVSGEVGVTSINSESGAITLEAGENVTVDTVGDTITISATGGGGGGVTELNTLTGSLSLTEGANITITPSGDTIEIAAISGASGITQLTGDVTAGPGSGSQVATLETVNADVGTFTFASVTADAKGRITAVADGPNASASTFGVVKVDGTTITASGGVISAVGGGGGGALVQLAQVVVGVGGAASIAFTDIPDTYTNLMLIMQGQVTDAEDETENIFIQFNGDTGDNYDYAQLYNTGTGDGAGGSTLTNTTAVPVGAFNASAFGSFASSLSLIIPSYAASVFYKTLGYITLLRSTIRAQETGETRKQ